MVFHFIEITEETMVGDMVGLERGEIYVISSLYTRDSSNNDDYISNENNLLVTKQCKKSTIINEWHKINFDAIIGMEILENNKFKVKLNENYDDYDDNDDMFKINKTSQQVHNEVIAYLICDKNFISGSLRGNKYNITTDYLYISGKNDTRTGALYAKLDHPLPNNIVHIRHENGKFFLAAFGRVRLNQALVKESAEGDVYWEELCNKSKMLINDEISIEFVNSKVNEGFNRTELSTETYDPKLS